VNAGDPAGRTPIKPIAVCDLHAKIDGRGSDPGVQHAGSQRESTEAYVRSQVHAGWTALTERYDDGGYTGANLERPALRQLLADIKAGIIDCVLVYKVDRLT
jgi:site-specific DNA recombinase